MRNGWHRAERRTIVKSDQCLQLLHGPSPLDILPIWNNISKAHPIDAVQLLLVDVSHIVLVCVLQILDEGAVGVADEQCPYTALILKHHAVSLSLAEEA